MKCEICDNEIPPNAKRVCSHRCAGILGGITRLVHGFRCSDNQIKEIHGITVIVHRAILKNKLKKKPCEICGSTEVIAHHDDYSKPLGVRWLCRKHHAEWHNKNISPILKFLTIHQEILPKPKLLLRQSFGK